MECPICCDIINKSNRKVIEHICCDFKCCLSCFKRFILDSVKDASCMNCNTGLTLDFISSVTPKVFYNKAYREHRTNIILSREKSLLPETQNLAERRIKILNNEKEIKKLDEEKKLLEEKIREISRKKYKLRVANDYISKNETIKERKKFIKACTKDGCRGFLSTAWKCGTCNTYACSDCHVIKKSKDDPEHKCNKDDVETAKLLAKDTKPCPKCAVPIFKISGCDQMWCTSCKTPFSWKTGIIEKGVIHNPHFYQWQRETNGGVAPRVPGDRPLNRCGELPWFTTVQTILKQRKETFENVSSCHRLINHIRQVILPRFNYINDINDNTDLRVDFLLGEIDEDKWKKTLQMYT